MNIKKLLLVMLLLFSFATYARDCATEFENKNYEKALVECTQEAEKGSSEAQYLLGHLYFQDEALYQKAIYWFTKSAEQGYVDAQYTLGILYDQSDDETQDSQKALFWYEKAVEQNDPQFRYYV